MFYTTTCRMEAKNEQIKKERIKTLLNTLPNKPGVYIMKNNTGEIIYIGKAKNLAKRVHSYFGTHKDIKTEFLTRNIEDIDFIITNNEHEALLLENNLIKKWKPKYNINLKDGKTYPVLKITNEDFPRVYRTRRIIFDGSTYFGPYTSVHQIDRYLKLIDNLFPLRKCKGKLKKRKHPCLNYYIGKCLSPCSGKIPREEYLKMVERVKELLSGKTEDLLRDLHQQMLKASENLEFEKAAKIRDNIKAVELTTSDQNVIDFSQLRRDYIGFFSKEHIGCFIVFQFREGKIIGREIYEIESFAPDEETVTQFLSQYYGRKKLMQHSSFPQIIYLSSSVELEERRETLETSLRETLKNKVRLIFPKRGKHLKIIKMAQENARENVEKRFKQSLNIKVLKELKELLSLRRIPHRIEGFDISHLGGQDTVASMVSFLNGHPDKASYRHYKIRSLKGKIDDYEAMREVIARRYQRILNEKAPVPDLILIDGGRGQLNAALSMLKALNLEKIDIIGLAKREEEIYTPTKSNPITLEKTSQPLRLLQYVRDESHRFANVLQKKLRKKRKTESLLMAVPGIGKSRAKLLLETFESLHSIAHSSPEEISRRSGLNISLSERLIKHLQKYLKENLNR